MSCMNDDCISMWQDTHTHHAHILHTHINTPHTHPPHTQCGFLCQWQLYINVTTHTHTACTPTLTHKHNPHTYTYTTHTHTCTHTQNCSCNQDPQPFTHTHARKGHTRLIHTHTCTHTKNCLCSQDTQPACDTHTTLTHTCTHTQNCLCNQDPQLIHIRRVLWFKKKKNQSSKPCTVLQYPSRKMSSHSSRTVVSVLWKKNPQQTSWITIVLTIPWQWVYLLYWYRYVSLPCRDGKWVQKSTLWESLESRLRNQIYNCKLT